ncbi:hypothetical protein HPO96_25365 [Kribbella sandramycini]|uniref:DUF1579 domain-containing protein n=1 Tax=Kribbella sandramycini TaxID=60450 RepID=A0A7Y4P2Z6_9ACTN|nr:hypothetical protein [Kribbella sandramycini]MBB6571011.1 hypothetical protein [Kribbella sandramycini]NOL43580.1 hypothetical protein [Kribbella sandramycini]
MTTWTKATSDFDFLQGDFDVRHRQLVDGEWISFEGTTSATTYFDGAISIDEMRFPARGTYGLSVRLFNPATAEWTIWWVSSSTMQLGAPVRGRWSADGSSCRMVGEELPGVLCSYEWSSITASTAHWEQAYSHDGGTTWETNWIMDFTRRSTPAPPLNVPKVTGDFDFLIGRWDMANRRRRPALGSPYEWYDVASVMQATTYFDGAISFDEGWFPTEGFRGATLRLYNPTSHTWSIHWINSLRGQLETPVIGAFNSAGIGTFEGPDTWEGHPINVRFIWTPGVDKATWEQLFSADNGQTWISNWQMQHTRIG